MKMIKAMLLGLLVSLSATNLIQAGFHNCKNSAGAPSIIIGSATTGLIATNRFPLPLTKVERLNTACVSLVLIAAGLIKNYSTCNNSKKGNKRLVAAGGCFATALACIILSNL